MKVQRLLEIKLPIAFVDVLLNLFAFALTIALINVNQAIKQVDTTTSSREITDVPVNFIAAVFISPTTVLVKTSDKKILYQGPCTDKKLLETLEKSPYAQLIIDYSQIPKVETLCLSALLNIKSKPVYFALTGKGAEVKK